MDDKLDLTCHACGNVGIADGSDGFFYCLRCGSQAEDIIDTAVDENIAYRDDPYGGGIYMSIHSRPRPATKVKIEPFSQSQPQSQFWESLKAADDNVSVRRNIKVEDGMGPIEPSDFGSRSRPVGYGDYCSEIRMRYVMGIQIMIQMQCKALVEGFGVNPLICGLAGTIWLRFVAFTRVFDDKWADESICESESQKEGLLDDFKPRAKYRAEPHNIHGQRSVMIWYRSLSKTIPLSHSLVISFLVCHLAREAVLPTDIIKWSLEGKLPYFSVFIEIDKQIGPPSNACPLTSSFMFKPAQTVPLHKLESQAASISQIIGLELPPVNFFAIASRYLSKLSLPAGKILPSVCQLYEWSFPPELWLSANELRLPTRICVMSMVIVAMRILYNIHGFGFWETNLSSSGGLCTGNGAVESTYGGNAEKESEKSSSKRFDANAAELLCMLESRYNELEERYEYSKDLLTYLQYCKDLVFARLEPSFDDFEEEKIIDELWNYYEDRKDSGISDDQKRSRDDVTSSSYKTEKRVRADDCSQQSTSVDGNSAETNADKAIRKMKSDMEEYRFCYIPPRVYVKRLDYLHYVRKKDEGAYTYAAHADYYILLRSCARAAEVDIRVMHAGVLSFERRLGWLEKRIGQCLNFRPQNNGSCRFCQEEVPKDCTDDSIDVSKLNL